MDIQVTALAKIIEGAMENDLDKVKVYANHIAKQLEEQDEYRAARIIRNRLDGTYKKESKIVSLDGGKEEL